MRQTITYTSTLSNDLMDSLNEFAQKLKVPKNQLIEQALSNYLEELKRMEYVRSFKRANQDAEIKTMAEEGMDDYLKMLDRL